MRKIFTFLMSIVLFVGCKNYQTDIEEYLSYWSAEAYIADATVKSVVQNDADGISSVPSAEDIPFTFKLHNPKSFQLELPPDADPQLDVIIFNHLKEAPVIDTDYTLTQSEDHQSLTLTYKAPFLQAHEWGGTDLSATLTLYAKDGRKFRQTYTFNIKANTPPPDLTYRAIGKTAVPDSDGKYYYVLFLEAKGMDTPINGSALLHGDMAYLAIAEMNGEYVQIPLEVKEDKSGFNVSGAAGRLLEADDAVQLDASDIESGAGTPDILPASTEKWIVRVKTDVVVKGAVKQYRFQLRDKAGLSSADELKTSTSTNKVNPVDVIAQSGNWIITPKSGTEADPHTITYQYGVEKILLQAATATTGATVHYKVERNGAVVSENSGTTPIPLELPAASDAVYKLMAWAVKDGFDNSPETHVFYKTKRSNELEITGGAGAWARLKNAVSVIENDDVIVINGIIQATADSGNNGAIEITKKITIKGKSGNADTDILDANKEGLGAKAHRLFTVQNSGGLILENLTLKNGKAAGTEEGGSGSGGAVLIKDNGSVTLSACTIQDCEVALSGGAVRIQAPNVTEQVLTVSGSKITGNEATGGAGYGGAFYIEGGKTSITDTVIAGNSSAQSGGGIFLYQGHCALDGVTIHGNSTHARGAGIYLAKPLLGSATLTVTGKTKIGSPPDTNTVCVGHLRQSSFVTAQALDLTAHINIEPQDYIGQKNKTLVKVTGDSAAAYKDYIHLTEVPAGETWELSPNNNDNELILKQATVISNGDSKAWKKLKGAVSSATDGDIIIVDGLIQATTDSDNHDEIAVNENLTIRGKSGAATDILDANKTALGANAHRIFKVTNSNVKLTLENFTLKGGKAGGNDEAGRGGGIYCKDAARLTIKNCTVTECEAKQGGAFCIIKGTAYVNDCTFTKNTAGDGGALQIGNIDDNMTVNITGGTIGGTSSADGNGGAGSSRGGGIMVYRGTCTVKDVTIRYNTAGAGSGIWLHGAYGGSAKLYIEGSVAVKDNDLMIGHNPSTNTFVTARNLDSAARIDIYPEKYNDQKDKPLVKATGTKPAGWESLFRLVKIPSGETWKLEKNGDDTELILKKE